MRDFPVKEEDLRLLFCEVDLAILLSAKDECGLIALCALSAGLPLYVCGDSAFASSLREVPFGEASTIEEVAKAEKLGCLIKKAKDKGRKLRLEEAEKLRSNFEAKHNWKTQIESLVGQMLDMFQGITFLFTFLTQTNKIKVFQHMNNYYFHRSRIEWSPIWSVIIRLIYESYLSITRKKPLDATMSCYQFIKIMTK